MKYIKFILLIAIAGFLFHACDKIKPPYKENINKSDIKYQFPSDSDHEKVMLLEKFTGHKCTYCPMANDTANNLINSFGEKLVIISAHVTGLAAPVDDYLNDLRSLTYGKSLDYVPFNIGGTVPIGMVNRKELLQRQAWRQAIKDSIDEPPCVDINMKTYWEHNNNKRRVDVFVQVIFLKEITSDLYLAVYLTEDSVISDQYDPRANPTHVENYVHRHVARAAINGTSGMQIVKADTGVVVGDTIVTSYKFTLPVKFDKLTCNAGQCYLVAFVYDNNQTTFHTDAKYVLQAAEARVKE